MLKAPKLYQKEYESTFLIFFITLRELYLENISLSYMLNLKDIS